MRKRWEDTEIQGQVHTPKHTQKEGTTKGCTEVLPRPEELAKVNYTVHGQRLAGAIDFRVLSPTMPLNGYRSG